MPLIAQIFTIISVLIFFVFIILRIRKSAIDYKYALLWIVLGLTILIFAVFPASFTFIADRMQIGMPLNLLFFLGILVCLMFIFGLASSYSKLRQNFYLLTQKNAILDKAVYDLTEKISRLEQENVNAEE